MMLRETDLFKNISPEVMEELFKICSENIYVKDTVLFEKGKTADCLYILEKGAIDLIIKNGGSLVYTLSEPGEVFGWSSMVEAGVYTATGLCATDSKVLRFEREKLDSLFDRHPDAGIIILKRLGTIFSRRLSNAYRDLLAARKQDTTPVYG